MPPRSRSLRGLLLLPRLPQLPKDVREPDLAQLCVLLKALHEPVFKLVCRTPPESYPRLNLGRLRERRLAARRG